MFAFGERDLFISSSCVFTQTGRNTLLFLVLGSIHILRNVDVKAAVEVVGFVADGAGEKLGALKHVFFTVSVERLDLDVIRALNVSRTAGKGKTTLAALLLAGCFDDLGIDELPNLTGLGLDDNGAEKNSNLRCGKTNAGPCFKCLLGGSSSLEGGSLNCSINPRIPLSLEFALPAVGLRTHTSLPSQNINYHSQGIPSHPSSSDTGKQRVALSVSDAQHSHMPRQEVKFT